MRIERDIDHSNLKLTLEEAITLKDYLGKAIALFKDYKDLEEFSVYKTQIEGKKVVKENDKIVIAKKKEEDTVLESKQEDNGTLQLKGELK